MDLDQGDFAVPELSPPGGDTLNLTFTPLKRYLVRGDFPVPELSPPVHDPQNPPHPSPKNCPFTTFRTLAIIIGKKNDQKYD
jgi:hypothetical protein